MKRMVEFLVWSLMFACVMSHVTNASCCGGPIPKYPRLYSSEVCSCSHGTPRITRAGDLTAHFQEITWDSGTFRFVDVCCLLLMVPKVIPKDLIIFLLARRAKGMEDCIQDFLQMRGLKVVYIKWCAETGFCRLVKACCECLFPAVYSLHIGCWNWPSGDYLNHRDFHSFLANSTNAGCYDYYY